MNAPVITVRGLTKAYKRRKVVDGINLVVEEGEVLGLLGPNGAGKTTTILMLMGLTEQSAGEVSVLGKDPRRDPLAVKQHVGYLPDAVGFYDNLSARENLGFTARLGGLPDHVLRDRISTALARVRLTEVADRRVATYSRGMRQRLGLAELLMRDCRILILDEPTSGLDPQSTQELLAFVSEFAREGRTVLVSSHLLDVVQSICTRVALFNAGRIGFAGTLDQLSARVAGGAVQIDVAANGIDLVSAQRQIPGVESVEEVARGRWKVMATQDIRPDLARHIIGLGGDLTSLDADRLGLAEAYSRFFKEVRHET